VTTVIMAGLKFQKSFLPNQKILWRKVVNILGIFHLLKWKFQNYLIIWRDMCWNRQGTLVSVGWYYEIIRQELSTFILKIFSVNREESKFCSNVLKKPTIGMM
jgi:hypothetical protein